MKYIAVIVMINLSQNCFAQQKGSIYGIWINKADKNSIVKIDKSNFCQIYKSDTVFLGKYIRTSTSCDSSYLKESSDKNLDFINVENGECYEITGLTDSTLAYRHTSSGVLQVFYKTHKVNLRSDWNLRVKQALHMKDREFNRFIKGTEPYDNRISAIMHDSTIANGNKLVEINKVLTERRAYVKEHLSEDQLKTLFALEKQRAIEKGSRYEQQKKEHEQRMKERALNRRPDSTKIKTPITQ